MATSTVIATKRARLEPEEPVSNAISNNYHHKTHSSQSIMYNVIDESLKTINRLKSVRIDQQLINDNVHGLLEDTAIDKIILLRLTRERKDQLINSPLSLAVRQIATDNSDMALLKKSIHNKTENKYDINADQLNTMLAEAHNRVKVIQNEIDGRNNANLMAILNAMEKFATPVLEDASQHFDL